MCLERRLPASRVQSGFALVTGIFLVVVLAALGAFMLFVSGLMTSAGTLDVQGSRAYQAARAGIEWGAYQFLRNAVGPFATSTCTGGAPVQENLTFPGTATLTGFTASVTCTSSVGLTEGGLPVTAYRIVSNGCNNPVACPAAVSATYVERQLSLSITDN